VNLLQRTGQAWKVWLFCVMLVLGGTASLLQGFLYEPLGKQMATQIAVAGMGLVVGSFIFAWRSVLCPKCELKLFSYAFKHQNFFSWFSWLLQQESCPCCGYPDTPRPGSVKRKTKGLKRP